LLTVIVNVATSPGNSGPLPLLLMCTSAHCTAIDALAVLSVWSAGGSFVALTLALLVSVPQSAVVVGRETVIGVVVAPLASVPANVQLNVPVAVAGQVQPAPAVIVQVPAGRVSLTLMPVAGPGPALLTVIVNVAVWPAKIGPLPVLLMWTSAHWTAIEALALLSAWSAGGSFVALTVAPLVSVPQSAVVVGRDTLIGVVVAPAASVPANAHVKLPVAVAGHVQPAPALIVQVPAGSVSVTLIPDAGPGPALLTVIVNVATSPGNSGPLPVLLMWTSAHWTAMLALALLSL
jgi:hypothetical protein